MSRRFVRRALALVSPRPALSTIFYNPRRCIKSASIIHTHSSLARRPLSSSNMERSLFEGTVDRYNGVTVESRAEPCPQDTLETKIDESLAKWVEEKKRCIWFKVSIQDSSWVPLLANRGFNFHHARDDFVMMQRWLPDSEPNLPPASHTNLGVGGIVLNDRNQLLAVSEKHYEYPHWKLPGGYVDRGEDIVHAAIREVQEETGIDTEFVSIVTFRHTHKMMFGNSDIYIIILLKPITEDIHISEREINQCQWMDVDEYLNHPNVNEFNRSVVKTALDYKRRGIKIDAETKTVRWATIVRDITVMSVVDLKEFI